MRKCECLGKVEEMSMQITVTIRCHCSGCETILLKDGSSHAFPHTDVVNEGWGQDRGYWYCKKCFAKRTTDKKPLVRKEGSD